VLAQTWPVSPPYEGYVAPGSDAETHVAALILCDGGVAITYERAEFSPTVADTAWQFTGDAGALRLRMTPGAGQAVVADTATAEGVASRTLWSGDESYTRTRVGVLEDFAGAVREGRRPKTGLEQALLVQEIADAVYASAAEGRAVSLP
jgi:predicted dehydrogenase